MHLAGVATRGVSYSFVPRPSLRQLLVALFPPNIAVAAIVGIAVSLLFRKSRWALPPGIHQRHLFLLIAWWLVPPLLFFIASVAGPSSVFLDRWFLIYTPAVAILAAIGICGIQDSRARLIAAALFTLVLIMREADHRWQLEDWRGVRNKIVESNNPTIPVLTYSGLVESDEITWLRDPAHRDHLLAPFTYYSVPNPTIPLPSAMDNEAKRQYFMTIAEQVQSSNELYLVSARKLKSGTSTSAEWRRAVESLGFTAVPVSNSKTIEAFCFYRPSASPSGGSCASSEGGKR